MPPVPSSRHRLSYDDCLEDKGENCQKCPVLYSVQRYCCAQRYAHMSSYWHCVRWEPDPSTHERGTAVPSFWPMSIVATVACLSYCWALVILLLCNLCSILFSVLLFTITLIYGEIVITPYWAQSPYTCKQLWHGLYLRPGFYFRTYRIVPFLANVKSRSRSLYAVIHPSVVCNVRAPYSASQSFRQCFYDIWYLGHPLTRTESFMEIVPEEPNRRGVKPKTGSKI